MLDSITPAGNIATLDETWKTTLAVGDIVSYRFPVSEDDGTAKPKARPCLVLDIETIAGKRYALLAYGTSVRSSANTGYEIGLRSQKALHAAGLHKRTRFVGARRLLVPLDGLGFALSTEIGSPRLGCLDEKTRKRMNAVRARIHAERDIAADRRAAQSRGSRRSKAPRPFTVEVRPSRGAIRRREAS